MKNKFAEKKIHCLVFMASEFFSISDKIVIEVPVQYITEATNEGSFL